MASISDQEWYQAAVEQLDAMSTRDRNLLTGLVVFAGLVVVGMLTWTLLGSLDNQASRVRDAKSSLLEIQAMKETYYESKAQIDAAEARMIKYGDQAISAFVEQIAIEEGVAEGLEKVPETGRETIGRFRQIAYKLELKRVTLEGALGFLHSLETSGRPIRVKSASFKTVSIKRERMIDLNLELLAYEFEESET
jgi:hypothetical protein